MGERFGSGARRRGRPRKQKDENTDSGAGRAGAGPGSAEEGGCPLCSDDSVAFATPAGKLVHETDKGLVICSASCPGCEEGWATFKAPSGTIMHEGGDEGAAVKCETPGLARLDDVPTASQASVQRPQRGQRPTGGPGDPEDSRSGHPGSMVTAETPPDVRAKNVKPPKGDERVTW